MSGTPAFLAPECFGARRCFGMPSDAWAAGVMLYQLLTGELPFWPGAASELHDLTPRALRDGIVNGAPRLGGSDGGDGSAWAALRLGQSAAALVAGLLEKDPRARLTAAEAAAHPWFAEALGAEAVAGAGAPAVAPAVARVAA